MISYDKKKKNWFCLLVSMWNTVFIVLPACQIVRIKCWKSFAQHKQILFEMTDRFMRWKVSLKNENTRQSPRDECSVPWILLSLQDQSLVCNILLLLLEIFGLSSTVKPLTGSYNCSKILMFPDVQLTYCWIKAWPGGSITTIQIHPGAFVFQNNPIRIQKRPTESSYGRRKVSFCHLRLHESMCMFLDIRESLDINVSIAHGLPQSWHSTIPSWIFNYGSQ